MSYTHTESKISPLLLIKQTTFIWYLSESFETTDSNQRQADSSEKYAECYGHIKDSTALGRGSDGPSAVNTVVHSIIPTVATDPVFWI